MIGLLAMVAASLAAFFGFRQARSFVGHRLRYVDSVHNGRSAVLAGAAALLIAAPVVWLLPIVGTGTALLFGASVGAGFAAGSRDVASRRLLS